MRYQVNVKKINTSRAGLDKNVVTFLNTVRVIFLKNSPRRAKSLIFQLMLVHVSGKKRTQHAQHAQAESNVSPVVHSLGLLRSMSLTALTDRPISIVRAHRKIYCRLSEQSAASAYGCCCYCCSARLECFETAFLRTTRNKAP